MAEEETYTHLVLLLNENMSIKQDRNSTESIYISKQKVSLPESEGVSEDVSEDARFTADNLQNELINDNLRLDVYLKEDLTVAKYKVSNETNFVPGNDYESVEFNGPAMYTNITPSQPAHGGMKLNKKPKKKTKKGTYKRQSNKTK